MKNCGHIAIGGDEGTLRVLQLPFEGGLFLCFPNSLICFFIEKLSKGPYKAFSHLEGHTSNGIFKLVTFYIRKF